MSRMHVTPVTCVKSVTFCPPAPQHCSSRPFETPDFRTCETSVKTLVKSSVVLGDAGKDKCNGAAREQRRPNVNAQEGDVIGFVDGSYAPPDRMGAGVYFGENDAHNRAVPVPKPSPRPDSYNSGIVPRCDSMRAELYAAVLFVYIALTEKHVPSNSRLIVYQDSISASHLLRSCQFGACHALKLLCPSRWAQARCQMHSPHSPHSLHSPKNQLQLQLQGASAADKENVKSKCEEDGGAEWSVKFVWGDKLNHRTVLANADVLDWWWLLTKDRSVEIRWVHAHQDAPPRLRAFEWSLWHGNDVADALAKLGANTNVSDRDVVAAFAHYPLFRLDPSINLPPKPNPATNYLPLHPPPRSSTAAAAESAPLQDDLPIRSCWAERHIRQCL